MSPRSFSTLLICLVEPVRAHFKLVGNTINSFREMDEVPTYLLNLCVKTFTETIPSKKFTLYSPSTYFYQILIFPVSYIIDNH